MTKPILKFMVLYLLMIAPASAQEIFSSISGRRAATVKTGETLHQYEFWIRPSPGATSATLAIFDPGLGGIADLVVGDPDTKTTFELFPFDSVYRSTALPLGNRSAVATRIASLETSNETIFLNRWYSFADLDPHDSPNGWIVRVHTDNGNDVNTFKFGISSDKGVIGQSSGWKIIAINLSVCLFGFPASMEAQFHAADGDSKAPPELHAAGEEDADVLVRDEFGKSAKLKGAHRFFSPTSFGMDNHWGLIISGSRQSDNNVVVRGVKDPVLWDLNAVVVERPKAPNVAVQQLPGTSCTNVTLMISEATRKELAGLSPIYVFGSQHIEKDTAVVGFPNPGSYAVTVLTPTRGIYFPTYWPKEISVQLNAPPVARITADKTVIGPGEVITLSSERSYDPEKAQLHVRWYVNGEFRSEERTLKLSSLVPATYEVKLVVNAGAVNSLCTESSDTKVVRVNSQPYAEIKYPLVFGRSDVTQFSVKRDMDSDGDSLLFTWSGSGIVGTDKGRAISIKHDVAGDYALTLTVNDQTGTANSTYSKTIRYRVNAEPKPQFSSPVQAAPGDVIALSGAQTLDPDSKGLKYTWELSTGDSLEGREVHTSFGEPGDYSITLKVDDGEGVTNSIETYSKTIHINAPPMPVITAADRSTSAKQQFSAEKTTDADQSRLKYVWNFGDGARDSGKVVSHVYQSSGTYTIALTVDDGQRQTNSIRSTTHTLVINKYPVAQFTIPQVWDPGTPLALDGSSSHDPDGQIAEYTWMVNGKEVGTGAATKYSFTEPGDYAVALQVRDNSGFDDAIGVKTLSVHINYPPIVRWKMVPDVAEPDVPVTFDASASTDPDGKIKTVTWNFRDGSALTGVKVTKTFKSAGLVNVRVMVDDGSGFHNAVQSAEGTILVNHAPIIVTKTFIRSNSRMVLLDATQSYDADNDALTFDWLLSDGTHRSDASFYWEVPTGGVHFVTLAVNDDRGKRNSITRETIRVLINRAPVAVVDSLVYSCTGQTILFNGSRSYDPDGDGISAKWDFKDGSISTETNPAHVYGKPGYYPVTLMLDDGFADQPTVATIPIIVEGSPIAAQSFLDTTVCVNMPIAFSGDRSYDPNGPIGSFTWDFGDGINTVGSNVVHAYSKPGVFYATLTVIGNGSGRCSKVSQVTSAIHVVEGPIAEFTIPERISAGEPLKLDASKSTSNGKIHNITWKAIHDGTSIAAAEGSTATFTFDKPGVYDVLLTISIESSTNCNTTSLLRKVIVNDPPVLVWHVPGDVALGDLLTLDGSSSHDPDGIITEFRWSLDGKLIGTTPVVRLPMSVAGTHAVSLTITDNSGTSSKSVSKSSTVRVNSEPNPSFTLPSTIYENELVTLAPARSIDADGDALTFTWKVDGRKTDTTSIRFATGRHTVLLIASDGRNVSNSVDSVQKEFFAVAKPNLTFNVPRDWIVGTAMHMERLTNLPYVGFVAGGTIQSTITLARSGERSITFGWAPKGEVLAVQSSKIVVWDSLTFTQSVEPRTITWNPSNPSIVLSAPPVNRPEGRNVRYEWRKGTTLIGVGKVIEAPLTKGRNLFVVRALDQDMVGAQPAETEIVVICE